MLKGTSIFISLKEYVIITLGMLLYIVGWSVFLVPNQLVGGGVSGLASVVQYATNGAVKMGYTYFVVNVVLLIIAMFILGNKFGFKTIYAIVIASVGLNVFQEIIPADICQTLAVENGKVLDEAPQGKFMKRGKNSL